MSAEGRVDNNIYIYLTPCVPVSWQGFQQEKGSYFEKGLAPPLATHSRRGRGKDYGISRE